MNKTLIHKKIFKINIASIVILIFLISCTKSSECPRIPVLSCENYQCESTIYYIEISHYNYQNKVLDEISYRDGVYYCQNINVSCGARMYKILKNLIQQDSLKFEAIMNNYNLKSIDEFTESLSENGNYNGNISSLVDELREACECN